MASSTAKSLPTLAGARTKARKRDEKQKYDPTSFRDEILTGLNAAKDNYEEASKFLDMKGNQLDYRQYADTLFDILIAGGMLLPGEFLQFHCTNLLEHNNPNCATDQVKSSSPCCSEAYNQHVL